MSEIGKAVANWWVKQAQCGVSDNGDRGPNGAFTMALAAMLQDTSRSQIEAVEWERFGSAIENAVDREIESGRKHFSLYVDYGPDNILGEAIQQAGNPRIAHSLPCKTGAWVEEGRAFAACGYGAQRVQIYPAD